MSSKKKKNKKKKPNLLQRGILRLGRFLFRISMKKKYGFYIENPVTVDEPFLAMSNHATDNDMMFTILGIKNFMYFVCSEHLFRGGFGAKLLVRLMDEIPLFKGSVAANTTREIIKRIRDGNNICIFPEGSRTFDGRTNPIAESTGKLVKIAKCALVTFHMQGGYFVQPRWAKTWRRGPISGAVVKVYSSQELEKMSVEEINAIIRRDLHEDAYETQEKNPQKYTGERLAEGIENILYMCPHCGGFETIRSKDNRFWCEACDMEAVYDEYGMFSGKHVVYPTVPKWVDWEEQVFEEQYADPDYVFGYRNENVTLSEIHTDHTQTDLMTGTLTADREGMYIGDYRFLYTEMEGTEYINLGNTFLFSYHNVYYSMQSDYLCGVKYRKLYIKRKELEAAQKGKRFDKAE